MHDGFEVFQKLVEIRVFSISCFAHSSEDVLLMQYYEWGIYPSISITRELVRSLLSSQLWKKPIVRYSWMATSNWSLCQKIRQSNFTIICAATALASP